MTDHGTSPQDPGNPRETESPPETPRSPAAASQEPPEPTSSPMVLLACEPAGGGWAVRAACQMNAYSPGGLVTQIAELRSYPPARQYAAEGSGYAELDPRRWTVTGQASPEDSPPADADAAEAGQLRHQATARQEETDRIVLLAAGLAVTGAVTDLAARTRGKDAAEFADAAEDWMTENGVDPATGDVSAYLPARPRWVVLDLAHPETWAALPIDWAALLPHPGTTTAPPPAAWPVTSPVTLQFCDGSDGIYSGIIRQDILFALLAERGLITREERK